MRGQGVPNHHVEDWEDAGFGWRVLATLIDSVVLFVLLVALIGVAAAMGSLQLPDPATTDPFDIAATQAYVPEWMYYAVYLLLFAYYALLEGVAGASIGKLLLGMRVHMSDGRRATGVAVVVRNLIRVPEALLYYIPSAIACLASKRHKRLGDFAAGTVVARRVKTAAPHGRAPLNAGPWQPPRPMPPEEVLGPLAMPLEASPPTTPAMVTPSAELARFKKAVLAAGGAHDTYLRFSEVELAKDAVQQGRGEREYSPEYVAAWYSLSEAVHALAEARASARAAVGGAGLSLETAIVDQPDLVYLTRRLAPYLAPGASERLHEAYVEVVRNEMRG